MAFSLSPFQKNLSSLTRSRHDISYGSQIQFVSHRRRHDRLRHYLFHHPWSCSAGASHLFLSPWKSSSGRCYCFFLPSRCRCRCRSYKCLPEVPPPSARSDFWIEALTPGSLEAFNVEEI